MQPDKFTMDLVVSLLRALENKFAEYPGREYEIRREYTRELVDMFDGFERSPFITSAEELGEYLEIEE